MIPVLFRDRLLAVCVKPPGVLSQDGPGRTLPALLREQLGGEAFPVHRLDREAGGVLVCARTRAAAGTLSAALAGGAFRKEYLCVLRGSPPSAEGTCTDLLVHDRARNRSFVVQRARGGAREARLDYRVLSAKDGLSFVLVRLHTGRTHQIRVQFASRGTPLLGDGRYGGGPGPLALWSFSLAFPHPSGRPMAFHALPEGPIWEPFAGVLKDNAAGSAENIAG